MVTNGPKLRRRYQDVQKTKSRIDLTLCLKKLEKKRLLGSKRRLTSKKL